MLSRRVGLPADAGGLSTSVEAPTEAYSGLLLNASHLRPGHTDTTIGGGRRTEGPASSWNIRCLGASIHQTPLPGSLTAFPLIPCQQYQEVSMSRPTAQTPSRRPALIGLMLLLLVTVVSVSKVTVEDIDLGEAAPPSASLTVDEETYYRFVAPRLDRMVVEVDRLAEMVNGKSRDIIELTISANRIETLSEAIVEFGEENGVPERFGYVHHRILQSTGTFAYAFDEARSALSRFDFSGMTVLVPQFNDAAHMLHLAQEEMTSIAGSDSALFPAGYVTGSAPGQTSAPSTAPID